MSKANPISLSKISSLVFQILKESGEITFETVSTKIINQIEVPDTKNDQRTIKRRVYDVLNVLTELGYIEKNNKIIHMKVNLPLLKGGNTKDGIEKEICDKEAYLIDKIKILMYYKLLIERNKKINRPNTAVQFPAIFVGFKDASNGEIKKSLDGKEVQIIASVPPMFFSPLNLLETIGFPVSSQIEYIRSIPNGNFFEELLFGNNSTNQKEQNQNS